MPARKPHVRRSGLNATDATATDATGGPAPAPVHAPTAGAGDAFFLVTCEHGGNHVPTPFQALFDGHEALLASHRGHDPGALAPTLRIRRNYPYTGRADGFCAYLRQRYPGARYIGVELELNQRHVRADDAAWRPLRTAIVASLLTASAHLQAAPPP